MSAASAPALTHMGIYTDHPEQMRVFYQKVMRMAVSDRGRAMLFSREIIFMTGDPQQHHQFVLVVREAGDPPAGALFQVSFKVQSLDELRSVVANAVAEGATELREMNHGNAWSVYFRDPDRNVVEVYMDTGWYTPQPFADRLPLELTNAEIQAITAQKVNAIAGSMPQEQWSATMQQRLTELRQTEPRG